MTGFNLPLSCNKRFEHLSILNLSQSFFFKEHFWNLIDYIRPQSGFLRHSQFKITPIWFWKFELENISRLGSVHRKYSSRENFCIMHWTCPYCASRIFRRSFVKMNCISFQELMKLIFIEKYQRKGICYQSKQLILTWTYLSHPSKQLIWPSWDQFKREGLKV